MLTVAIVLRIINIQFITLAANYFLGCMLNFYQLNTTTQACFGYNLTLECSTTEKRVGSTVFQGDLLDCSSLPNEILLLHSYFNMYGGTSGTCNSGKIHAQSLPLDNQEPCYTSHLHIMVNRDMIGNSIKCVYDDGATVKEVGNFTIEQCHPTTVSTVAPSTGKLVIPVGTFNIQNYY